MRYQVILFSTCSYGTPRFCAFLDWNWDLGVTTHLYRLNHFCNLNLTCLRYQISYIMCQLMSNISHLSFIIDAQNTPLFCILSWGTKLETTRRIIWEHNGLTPAHLYNHTFWIVVVIISFLACTKFPTRQVLIQTHPIDLVLLEICFCLDQHVATYQSIDLVLFCYFLIIMNQIMHSIL